MGLDDLIPDDVDTSSSNRGGGSSKRSKKEYHKTIQGPNNKEKKFTEERWKEVKRVITQKFDDSLQEVLNNYTASERYSVVHDAALIVDREKTAEEVDREPSVTCDVCGAECSTTGVEIMGIMSCPQHPAAMISKELE